MKTLILILALIINIECDNEYIIIRHPDGKYVKEFNYSPYYSDFTGNKISVKRFAHYKNAAKAVDVIRENEGGEYKYQIIEVEKMDLFKPIARKIQVK